MLWPSSPDGCERPASAWPRPGVWTVDRAARRRLYATRFEGGAANMAGALRPTLPGISPARAVTVKGW